MASIGTSNWIAIKQPLESTALQEAPLQQAGASSGSLNSLQQLSTHLLSTYTAINQRFTEHQEMLNRGSSPMPPSFDIASPTGLSTVKIQDWLGEGSHGEVYRVSVSRDGGSIGEYALKVAKRKQKSVDNERCKRNLNTEVNMLREWAALSSADDVPLARLIAGPLSIGPDRTGFLQELYGDSLSRIYQDSLDGLSLESTKACAAQIAPALHALEQAGMTHLDIKPDNILYDTRRQRFCIADAGSCLKGAKRANEKGDYVVSRYYRPPEIVYGKPYGPPVDKWSFGCTLFEVFTGQILFPAANTPDLKRMFPSFLGPAPQGFLAKASDSPSSSSPVAVSRDRFFTEAMESKLDRSDGQTYKHFNDFLAKTLRWEPSRRLTGYEMQSHPFLGEGNPVVQVTARRPEIDLPAKKTPEGC